MKGLRSSLLLGVLILACTLLLSSCGGGGSNSTPADSGAPVEPYLKFSNAQEAASGALDAIKLFNATNVIAGASTSRVASGAHKPGTGPVMTVINEAISVNSNNAAINSRSSGDAFSRQASTTQSCSGGGTKTTGISGNDLTADFSSCKDGSTYLDGSMTVHYAGNAETPSSMTITIPKLHVSDTYEGFDIVFSSFSMDVSTIYWANYEIDSMIVKLNGDASGKLDSTAPGSLDISCDNYTGAIRKVAGGETLTVTGKFKTSACFSDWMTAVTTVQIFIPDGGNCPTAGEIICYYESNSVKVDFNSSQQEDIYFDSALTDTFSDCREAEAVCF